MSKPKIDYKTHQMIDNKYATVTNPFTHICCDCGLAHEVKIKVISRQRYKIKFIKLTNKEK
jgi:hypothetical protein